jgi:hypothetical protein
MATVIHFHGGDDGHVGKVAELIARFAADGVAARVGSDRFDRWIEFDDSTTLIHLDGDEELFASGRAELSLASLQEDLERIVPVLKDMGFTILDDEDGEL